MSQTRTPSLKKTNDILRQIDISHALDDIGLKISLSQVASDPQYWEKQEAVVGEAWEAQDEEPLRSYKCQGCLKEFQTRSSVLPDYCGEPCTVPQEHQPTSNTCKNCRQGYTRNGFVAYPDHIELCPLHAAAQELLEAAKGVLEWLEIALPKFDGPLDVGNGTHQVALRAAIAKAKERGS